MKTDKSLSRRLKLQRRDSPTYLPMLSECTAEHIIHIWRLSFRLGHHKGIVVSGTAAGIWGEPHRETNNLQRTRQEVVLR